MNDIATPRPAATAILLRECTTAAPFEVLLLKRAKAVAFAGGLWVFPGGAIEPDDYESAPSIETGDQQQMLAVATRAAVRETKEECNIDISEQQFEYYSHWTTPETYKKRFATWFVLGQVPPQQAVVVDDYEITAHQWAAPADFIAQFERGEADMMAPTYICLAELSACDSIEAAMALAKQRAVPSFTPKQCNLPSATVFLYEGDAGYAAGDPHIDGARHRLERKGQSYRYLQSAN